MVLPSSEEEEEFAQSYSWKQYTGKNCYENLESIDAFNAWNVEEDDYADVCKNRCETTAGCNVAKFMRGNAPGWAKNWKKCTLYKTLPAFTDATTYRIITSLTRRLRTGCGLRRGVVPVRLQHFSKNVRRHAPKVGGRCRLHGGRLGHATLLLLQPGNGVPYADGQWRGVHAVLHVRGGHPVRVGGANGGLGSSLHRS